MLKSGAEVEVGQLCYDLPGRADWGDHLDPTGAEDHLEMEGTHGRVISQLELSEEENADGDIWHYVRLADDRVFLFEEDELVAGG